MAVISVINQNIPLASKLDQKKGIQIDPIQILLSVKYWSGGDERKWKK